jgi:hypothetical protein
MNDGETVHGAESEREEKSPSFTSAPGCTFRTSPAEIPHMTQSITGDTRLTGNNGDYAEFKPPTPVV